MTLQRPCLLSIWLAAAAFRAVLADALSVSSCACSLVPAGWFASGAVLGGFGPDAQGSKARPAAVAAARTWAVGVPLGIAIRSVSRGYVPAVSFMAVAMAATGVLMVGWRTALAAATPEVRS